MPLKSQKQVEKWERCLWDLMSEIQEANGEHSSDLEHMVRFAWLESRREQQHLREVRGAA